MKTKRTKSHRRHQTKGEICRYDGPPMETVQKSFETLFSDLIFDLGKFLSKARMSLISMWISKFLTSFWKQSQNCLDGQEVKHLAERCKERRNDLISVVSQFIDGEAPAFPGDFYVFSDSKHKIPEMSYPPNSFKAVINYIEEVEEELSRVVLRQSPGFYVYLHKILFHLISSFDISEEEFITHKEKVCQILLLPVSLGQVYEHMNPTPDVMEEYGLDLLNQLRKESTEPSDGFWSLFNDVVSDIQSPFSSKNVYIHDIKRARERFLESKNQYSYKDYYLSAKASNSNIEVNGQRIKVNSLYSSIVEPDLIGSAPEVIAFDNLVGYQSGYLNHIPLERGIKARTDMVITQMIPNPGKYKPRAIHVGCNSVQDRCKFLHRTFADFLNRIPSCCMKQHYTGVLFLKEVTDPSYRLTHRNNVFVSDFSNATDTLNQSFQCKVIEVLFNDTFSNFWKFISELPKKFRHPKDSSLEDYKQMTGQPQGLLASFDAFSLAHIFLICMLMKAFGLERRKLSETLAIVGDDSIISYPSGLEDPESNPVTFYTFHSWLCNQVSLIKNDSKTGKSFFDRDGFYSPEVLDFAKISIKEGVFLTPVPYGLASAYASKPGCSDLQLIFWLNSKGLTYKTLAYRKLFDAYYKYPYQLTAATSVLSSGEVPFFEGFEDSQFSSLIDPTIRGVSMYMFYLNQLEHTFLSSILTENLKSELKSEDFFSKCCKQLEKDFFLFNENLSSLLSDIGKNHKYMIMLDKNMTVASDVADILSFEGESGVTSLLLGVLVNEEYASLFNYASEIHHTICEYLEKDDKELWMLFARQDFSIFKDLSDPLKSFQVKSMKKVSSNNVIVAKSSARKTSKLISSSNQLSELANERISSLLEKFIEILPQA